MRAKALFIQQESRLSSFMCLILELHAMCMFQLISNRSHGTQTRGICKVERHVVSQVPEKASKK